MDWKMKFVMFLNFVLGFSRKSVNEKSFFTIPSFLYISIGKEFNSAIRPIKIFLDHLTNSLHLTVKTEHYIA